MGARGAVVAASPEAAQAALRVLADGGSAADAAIAAHLVLAVDSPQATGVGGDLLALVRTPAGVTAFTGTGVAGRVAPTADRPGSTVTVPGFLHACADLHAARGRLPWSHLFAEAVGLTEGMALDAALHRAVRGQERRLRAAAPDLPLLDLAVGAVVRQPELGALLTAVRDHGVSAWTERTGVVADAVRRAGGELDAPTLAAQRTLIGPPVSVPFAGGRLAVQPPPSQGPLLAMAARWADEHVDALRGDAIDHLLVEATKAAFDHRDDLHDGSAALLPDLVVDPDSASQRSGPRAYLHTAGVSVADADGMVVSSLSSVFDDFGSAVPVPELGVLLNNRAEGFTGGRNAYRPGARPVHTLAPAVLEHPSGVLGIATPGADGQVQTLLAVLVRSMLLGTPLARAIAAPRWRSQSGALLVERSITLGRQQDLARRGHRVEVRDDGDDLFGAVAAVRSSVRGAEAFPDHRRRTAGGTL